MKTYDQLTHEQQEAARKYWLTNLLQETLDGSIVHEGLRERVEEAWSKAEAMQTPWFAGEYIMDTCKDDLEAIALTLAKDALYHGPGDPPCVYLSDLKGD